MALRTTNPRHPGRTMRAFISRKIPPHRGRTNKLSEILTRSIMVPILTPGAVTHHLIRSLQVNILFKTEILFHQRTTLSRIWETGWSRLIGLRLGVKTHCRPLSSGTRILVEIGRIRMELSEILDEMRWRETMTLVLVEIGRICMELSEILDEMRWQEKMALVLVEIGRIRMELSEILDEMRWREKMALALTLQSSLPWLIGRPAPRNGGRRTRRKIPPYVRFSRASLFQTQNFGF